MLHPTALSSTLLGAACALLLATAPVAAQQATPVPTPATDQDPDKTVKPDPVAEAAARIAELQTELQRIEKELAHLREIGKQGGLVSQVKGYLDRRTLSPRSIADPSPRPAPVAAPAPAPEREGTVRLLGDDEREKLGDEVVFTVDSHPVTQDEFDAMYRYLRSYQQAAGEDEIKKQTVLELVINRAAASAFSGQSQDARERILAAKRKVDGGTDFAAVAKEMSQCPSAANGGDLGEFGRVGMDASFAMASFTTAPGKVSDVVQSAFGYHLIKVTGYEKGASPDQDRVKASHILAMFGGDQNAIRTVMMNARMGKVELAFASDAWRKFSPF